MSIVLGGLQLYVRNVLAPIQIKFLGWYRRVTQESGLSNKRNP